MPKYQHDASVVEAVEWDPTTCLDDSGLCLVDGVQFDSHGNPHIHDFVGQHAIVKGDFIVTNPDGYIWKCPAHTFRETFIPVP